MADVRLLSVMAVLLCTSVARLGATDLSAGCSASGPKHESQHSHCDIIIGVYSAYDNDSVIDAARHSMPGNISIMCYVKHVCLHHKVDVVWFVNINSSKDAPTKYSTSDSDQLYEESGISIHSTCPEYECQSTIILPSDDEKLNNTEILCGGFTEVCPGEMKYLPNSVRVITKRAPFASPAPDTTKRAPFASPAPDTTKRAPFASPAPDTTKRAPFASPAPDTDLYPCNQENATWLTGIICRWRTALIHFMGSVGRYLVTIYIHLTDMLTHCVHSANWWLQYIYARLRETIIHCYNSIGSWLLLIVSWPSSAYVEMRFWTRYYYDYIWKLAGNIYVTCTKWVANHFSHMWERCRLEQFTKEYALSLFLLYLMLFLIILTLLQTRNHWLSNCHKILSTAVLVIWHSVVISYEATAFKTVSMVYARFAQSLKRSTSHLVAFFMKLWWTIKQAAISVITYILVVIWKRPRQTAVFVRPTIYRKEVQGIEIRGCSCDSPQISQCQQSEPVYNSSEDISRHQKPLATCDSDISV